MELLIYLLKVNLIFSTMYLVYRLFMQQTVFHQWKRVYLLAAPVLALVFPLISLLNAGGPIYTVVLEEFDISASAAVLNEPSISVWNILLIIWSIGLLIVLFTAVRNIVLSYRASVEPNVQAFTFLKRIHISNSFSEKERSRILAHEKVHADQLHTLDLLWYELLRVVFWFNPLFLLGRRSLKLLHEYIADEEANRITEDYSETLLANAFGISVLPLANEFNSNNTKNRISMIKKRKSAGQRFALLGSILLVAVASVSIGWTAFVLPANVGKERVYEKVEKMPHFPGCEEASMSDDDLKKCSMKLLMNFMGENVKYPGAAKKNNDEGTVMVKFVVSNKGEITKATVVKNVTEELDAEALRVINAMPNWVPGEHEGKKVNVAIVLPIRFQMS